MDALNLQEKIEKAEKDLEFLKSQLDQVYPEPIKNLYDYFIFVCNRQDERIKGMLRRELKSIGDEEFKNSHTNADYALAYATKRQINAQNETLAKETVNTLYERLRTVVGDNMNYDGLLFTAGELSGIVTGKNGKAEVKVIVVGGYNIQKIHARFFVKAIDE